MNGADQPDEHHPPAPWQRIPTMASSGLELFVDSEEGREGAAAFADKRPPDFARHVR
jgi:1,4-dihydroxy-2-naphthoyl-CoA synthase